MPLDMPSFQQFVTERIYVQGQTAIDERELAYIQRAELTHRFDYERRALFLNLRSFVHGMTNERVVVYKEWPKDWWEAFKERWFPKWALRRWPVQRNVIDIDQPIYLAVCPHIHEPENGTHLQWMAAKYEESNAHPPPAP